MTPAEALDATRDAFVSILHAHASADGIKISVGQIYGMLDTAMERAGVGALVGLAVTADGAATAYAATYETVPETVAEAAAAWTAQRDTLSDFPNLSGLIAS